MIKSVTRTLYIDGKPIAHLSPSILVHLKLSGAGTIVHGEVCTLTAMASEGYHFVSWRELDGAFVSDENPYSFTVTEDVALVANFGVNSYDITATVVPAEGGTVTGTGTYNHGETATLTATPAEGYTFVDWWRDDTYYSEDPILTITVTEASAFVANIYPPQSSFI